MPNINIITSCQLEKHSDKKTINMVIGYLPFIYAGLRQDRLEQTVRGTHRLDFQDYTDDE